MSTGNSDNTGNVAIQATGSDVSCRQLRQLYVTQAKHVIVRTPATVCIQATQGAQAIVLYRQHMQHRKLCYTGNTCNTGNCDIQATYPTQAIVLYRQHMQHRQLCNTGNCARQATQAIVQHMQHRQLCNTGDTGNCTTQATQAIVQHRQLCYTGNTGNTGNCDTQA